VREATAKDIAQSAATAKKATLILGRQFGAPVRQEGEVVGRLTARISPDQVIRRVLGRATDDRSEIPFAIDTEGTLYTRTTDERSQLELIAETQPVVQKLLMKLLSQGLSATQNHVVMLGRQTAQERLAWFLLRIMQRSDDNPNLDLPMSRLDIADYLGLTIETVSRGISQFKRLQLITDTLKADIQRELLAHATPANSARP